MRLELDYLRLEPTIYLLPEWDTEDEALQLLGEVSNEIFEEQLNGCHRVPSVWAGKRDLKSFLLSVRRSCHSVVIDLYSERLRHVDM